MIIRHQISCEIANDNKWCINFVENGNIATMCAIPTTNGDRLDIILQTQYIGREGSNCYKTKYIYNHKGSLRKLKGEKIIIRIKSGEIKLEHKK